MVRTSMKIEEIIKLPEVGYRIAEAHLNLVKEGPDIAAKPNPCCPIPEYKHLTSAAWQVARYCKMCNRLTIIFPGDRAGDRAGGQEHDPYQVYEEPTAEMPLLSFEAHNHFIDFCTMVDPYQSRRWTYPNVYALSGDYKRYIRMLRKTGKPDLVGLYEKLGTGDKRKAFLELNVVTEYDACYDLIMGDVEIL